MGVGLRYGTLFFLYLFLPSLQRGRFLTFGHIGLTIHTLFPLLFSTLDASPNTRPEFTPPLHILLLLSLRNLSPFSQPFALVFISYTLSIKYPYRPQASAAAAICLKQYHIPLNPFLSFVSLYIRRGNGVLGSWAEYDRPFLFVILGCLCLVDGQKRVNRTPLGRWTGRSHHLRCVLEDV